MAEVASTKRVSAQRVKHVILIDYENVGSSVLKELALLGSDIQVLIFYTNSVGKVSFSDVSYLMNLECHVEFVFCNNGTPSALDFQLISYLGFALKSAPKRSYTIISRDKGYDCALSFWGAKGYSVSRKETVTGYATKLAESKQKK